MGEYIWHYIYTKHHEIRVSIFSRVLVLFKRGARAHDGELRKFGGISVAEQARAGQPGAG